MIFFSINYLSSLTSSLLCMLSIRLLSLWIVLIDFEVFLGQKLGHGIVKVLFKVINPFFFF